MPLALYADLVWSKRRTMEIYLNVVEWGPGVFGAEAAARHYFKRSAKQFSLRQSALLAATLPNPMARDPGAPEPCPAGRRRPRRRPGPSRPGTTSIASIREARGRLVKRRPLLYKAPTQQIAKG